MTDVNARLRELRVELPRVELLPDDAFLRRLPRNLDASQRHDLEAVLLAADCISISLNRLVQICFTVSVNPAILSTLTRAEMFSAVWSIVDNLDVIYNLLLRSTNSHGPKTTDLRNNLHIVREVRNWRQHMKSKLGNAINQKGLRWPLFGAISFAIMPSRTDEQALAEPNIERAECHMIFAGSIGGNEGNDRILIGDDAIRYFRKTFNGPYFQIRDEEIDLLSIHQKVIDYLNFASKKLEESFNINVETYALEHGRPLKEIVQDPLPILHFIYELEIDKQPS
jgi:hypothetical protein